jgi:hypothetical protein
MWKLFRKVFFITASIIVSLCIIVGVIMLIMSFNNYMNEPAINSPFFRWLIKQQA